MNKIIKILFVSLLLLSQIVVSQATPFTTRLTSNATNIEVGQSFTVTFEVRGSAGIFGLTSNLNYDSNKLEITGSSAESGFALTLGTKIVVDHTESKSGNFNFARVTFKAKNGFAVGETTQISLSNVVGSDGTQDVSGSGSSITINMVPPKSINNFLTSLETNAGTINFSKNTLSYTLIVDNAVSSANITGTLEDSKATVSGLGNKKLKVYSNPFNITVTAENGATRRYTLNIIRRDESGNVGALSTNNALKSLGLDVCSLSFSADTLEYACEVDNLIEAYVLNAEVADNKATLTKEAPEKLSLGPNIIKLSITAESGDIRVYTITITRSTSAPTVSIDKLEEALKTLTSDEVGIIEPEDGIVSDAILNLIKTSQKTLVVKGQDESGSTQYEWHIDGSKITTSTSINTKLIMSISFESKIDELLNHARGIFLDFDKNESLPEGTFVKVKVSHMYSDGEFVKLYYYDTLEEKMTLKEESLEVIDGHVMIPLSHTSEYVLTKAILNAPSSNTSDSSSTLWMMIAGLELLLILGLGLIIFKQSKLKFR